MQFGRYTILASSYDHKSKEQTCLVYDPGNSRVFKFRCSTTLISKFDDINELFENERCIVDEVRLIDNNEDITD